MARQTKTGHQNAIINGELYLDDTRQFSIAHENFVETIEHESIKAIRVESISSNWQQREWIGDVLVVGDLSVEMTLRKERRGNKNHWYAYRRFGGVLHKRYVGLSDAITEERIVEIAKKLPNISHITAKRTL